jgi:hypothetical protein
MTIELSNQYRKMLLKTKNSVEVLNLAPPITPVRIEDLLGKRFVKKFDYDKQFILGIQVMLKGLEILKT